MKKLLLKGLLFLMPVVMLAQEKISGTVKDTEGEPMLGVSIIIKKPQNKGYNN
ncbi:exported hypothetical protein [Capnocytophaga canimorsus]|uniref:Uncharacterized protein n=1 Tax=Capnocytophaga canimorsus TaxID=28188 RepID=A0A0B7IHA1_9FLAO|nr:hypothetical protein [Capnocytophaga canimorsus]CEN49994.1 exported hypothetical protein [Capnocytophaga canimorsus]